MSPREVPTTAFTDQRPGTSGLRKKTRVFMQPGYLENFVQSVFNVARGDAAGAGPARTPPGDAFRAATLVVGGDGRYHNREATAIILKLAVANGFGRILVGKGGILSTPAMSAVIRRRGALGGLVLTASHNPGGPDADFGIKYNVKNGGPAPESVTEGIYRESRGLRSYLTIDRAEVDLDREGPTRIGATEILVIDPLADYTTLMEELFDFRALRGLFTGGFHLAFDAMHGVTGPYARRIFEEILGAPEGTVIHGVPLEDFGGHHPDPNLTHAADLVLLMAAPGAPGLGAACDGDGDRNLILGPGFFVTPGDSLAVIAEQAACIPGYSKGLRGVARSMPTSTAVDRVAAALKIPCYETPTGWKFFGNLMDAGLCTLCGEESFGTGSDHLREKDGLWAVLCWLSILVSRGEGVEQVVRGHWRRFGRSYYQRHDYEGLDPAAADSMIAAVRGRLPSLQGTSLNGMAVLHAEDFSYTDPVDGATSGRQGIRVLLEGGSRLVGRLSGTGTEGAIFRLYLEGYRREPDAAVAGAVLAPLEAAAEDLFGMRRRLGRDRATLVT